MNALMKWGAAFIAALFEIWVGRIKRDNENREQGRSETIKKAEGEADDRNKVAKDSDAHWAGMSDDEREKLRNANKHYRD